MSSLFLGDVSADLLCLLTYEWMRALWRGGHGSFWEADLGTHTEYFDKTREMVWNQQCKTECPSLYWEPCRQQCIWGINDLD